MKVIPPDFSRRIDLPGVGPCPRPVDIDQGDTGFKDLRSLRIYDFADGAPVEGEAEEDEVLVVLLSGAAAFVVTGEFDASFDLSPEGDRAVYLPPRHHYRLTPTGDARVAYARARPEGAADAPRAFAATDGRLAVDAPAERLRLSLQPLAEWADASDGLDHGLERLVHLMGPACVRSGGLKVPVARGRTLALEKGEGAHVAPEDGPLEVLAVGA